MALRFLQPNDNPLPLITNWRVNGGNAISELINKDSEISVILKYPLKIVQENENYSESQVYLFKNRFFSREDQCYNVTLNENRCGIIFPIRIYSNSSELPDITDRSTKFTYRFLHIAYYHLINNPLLPSKSIEYSKLINEDLKIEDFYDNETVVFLYHNPSEPKPNLKKAYPSLLKFGYVPLETDFDLEEIEMIVVNYKDHPLYNKNILETINLKLTKSKIIEEKFIDQIFSSILKYRSTPLAKFFLLYQVIELLIDRIAYESYHKNKLSIESMRKLLSTANKSPSFRNINQSLKEVQEKLTNSIEKIKTEDKRIKILFDEKCKLKLINYSQFTILAQEIIGSSKICSLLPDFVYQLRNRIIHDYHNLTQEHLDIDTKMEKLNIEFEKIIADIIIFYR